MPLLSALCASAAWAGDGAIEINQARALAGGVTPGDAPGFPVSIAPPGSDRLTSGLGVVGVGLDAIQITASDVTLDLAGFGISCRVAFPVGPCSGASGTGNGVSINGTNVRIENGTIRDMAANGVFASFNSHYALDRVRAIANGANGLLALDNSQGEIGRSGFVGNGGAGMRFEPGLLTGTPRGLVYHTMTDANGGGGIQAPAGSGVPRVAVDTLFLNDGGHLEAGIVLLSCIESLGRRCPP